MEKKLANYYNQSVSIPEGFSSRVMENVYSRLENQTSAKVPWKLKLASGLLFGALLLLFSFFLFRSPEKNLYKEISFVGQKGDTVLISGDFNRWQPEKMRFDGKKWKIRVKISPQVLYQYVFVVNGEVKQAEENTLVTEDYFGQPSSTLLVLQ